MNYGFVDNSKSSLDENDKKLTAEDESEDKDIKNVKGEKRKAQQQEPSKYYCFLNHCSVRAFDTAD